MLHCKRRLLWNISKNMTYTSYFFRRNRDLGTTSVYGGYRDVRYLPPICTYMVRIYICTLINTPPTLRGGDNQPTENIVSGGSSRRRSRF